MIILLPLWYPLVFTFWVLVIGTIVVLYAAVVVIVFLATLAAMTVRAVFRSQWPRNPRRPSIKNRRRTGFDALGRPIQARWSDRR
jgi:hypothetical protein